MSDALRRTEVYLRMMNNGLSKTKLDDSSALAPKVDSVQKIPGDTDGKLKRLRYLANYYQTDCV